jgi:hypothetical protein
MRPHWLAGLMGMAMVGLPSPARPCSFPAPTPHALDVAAQQVDHTPPSLVGRPVVAIQRGPSPEGCGAQQVTSCDGIGSLSITPAAADDRASAAELGFRLRVLSGSLPAGLTLPNTDVRAPSGAIQLHWQDGIEDEHEAFSFTLELAAVDTAGNISPPVMLVVGDGGSTGSCAIGGAGAAAWWPLGLLMMLAALGRTLRRR